MARPAAQHWRSALWAASWVQPGVAWASTRVIPISAYKHSCPMQYFANTNSPWLTANEWLLPCYPGTNSPYYKSDGDFDTPESAAHRSESQASTTWSWSEKSRFSSIGALCTHSWWVAIFFRFSALERSDHLEMVRPAAQHCRRALWAASWVQSGVVWARTRVIPISDWKPS